MNKTFVIADLRLFNNNQRENMGFSNFEDMNKEILRIWNSTVQSNDVVFVMGDIGNGNFNQMKEIISQLNGKLYLISKDETFFSKEQLLEIGFYAAWNVSMYKELEDNRVILYCVSPVRNIKVYKQQYCLLITDHNNEFDGMVKDIMLSADAKKWSYCPLDSDNLMEIYQNMKEFEQMENEEHKTEIKEAGE